MVTGADICGFQGNASESLCARWVELGAFYPLSRNRNTWASSPQELYAFGPTSVVTIAAQRWLGVRYALLPYLYTLLLHSHITGEPMMRPLFYDFSDDSTTWAIDHQFLLGDALLVCPVLEDGTDLSVYIPEAKWYNLLSGSALNVYGDFYDTGIPLDYILVLVRGGYIVPRHAPALTVEATRLKPFDIIVAMAPANLSGEVATSYGTMILDDGVSLPPPSATGSPQLPSCTTTMQASKRSDLSWKVHSSCSCQLGYALPPSTPALQRVVIYGYGGASSDAYFNLTIKVTVSAPTTGPERLGASPQVYYIHTNFYEATYDRFTIESLSLPVGASWALEWTDGSGQPFDNGGDSDGWVAPVAVVLSLLGLVLALLVVRYAGRKGWCMGCRWGRAATPLANSSAGGSTSYSAAAGASSTAAAKTGPESREQSSLLTAHVDSSYL